LNWLDWLLIAILLFFAIGSARRGFAREIIGLAATIFALVLGMWFYGSMGAFAARWLNISERTADFVGFIAIVIAVLVCGAILGWIVNRFLQTIGLSFFDRLLGAAFGLAKGFIVSITLLTAFMAFGPVFDTTAGAKTGAAESAVLHSRIAPYVLEASHIVVAMAPMELKSSFQKQYTSVKSALTSGTR
jgi:membrane protein required for colicin V production